MKSNAMTTKAATAEALNEQENKYRAGIKDLQTEFSTVRQEMKKTDAEIRRLETSTRRKLDRIHAGFRVEQFA